MDRLGFESLLSRWGLIAVFWGCFFEGETAAMLGGVIIHRGLLDWVWTALAAFLGAFIADQMWFLLSRHMSRRKEIRGPAGGQTGGQTGGGISGRIGHWLGTATQKARSGWVHDWLSGHPDGLTLAFRFVPGTRIIGPVLLAQTDMGWGRFSLLNGLSCAVWAAGFTALGYHFGRAFAAVFTDLHALHPGLLVLGFGAAGLSLRVLLRRRTRR